MMTAAQMLELMTQRLEELKCNAVTALERQVEIEISQAILEGKCSFVLDLKCLDAFDDDVRSKVKQTVIDRLRQVGYSVRVQRLADSPEAAQRHGIAFEKLIVSCKPF
jgi:thermostable 8-oxoguanine DNA glycosylase